jgi:hypothetical protein
MKRTIIIAGALISLIGLPEVRGQSIAPSTLNATGGTGTISGNIYDWSVSEMTMISTFSGSSVVVTQGILQPDVLPSGVASKNLAQQLQVFPNPASSFLNIRFTSAVEGKLSCQLMDLSGKVLMNRDVTVSHNVTSEQLNIASLAAATYMLEVTFETGDGQQTTSYKIEKLK